MKPVDRQRAAVLVVQGQRVDAGESGEMVEQLLHDIAIRHRHPLDPTRPGWCRDAQGRSAVHPVRLKRRMS